MQDTVRYDERYESYKQMAEDTLQEFLSSFGTPSLLYEPIHYTLTGGGKRIRPVLTMLGCEAVGGTATQARFGAIAVEIIHNFTLVHDDIMDAAPMRRNRATVHTQWNDSAAILAGDAMIALAYQAVLQTPNIQHLAEIIAAFNTGILEVCEGQALDLEFQERDRVTLDEYLLMIEKKTARMLEFAAKVGGYIGNGEAAHIAALTEFANAIGVAFQIQDDLLDATADHEKFGKTVGGDIVEGKKTYLILRALDKVQNPADSALLEKFVRNTGLTRDEVPLMQELFERNGIFGEAQADIERLTGKAHTALDALPASEARTMLHWFANMLLEREH